VSPAFSPVEASEVAAIFKPLHLGNQSARFWGTPNLRKVPNTEFF
jgi:hypothetical protein